MADYLYVCGRESFEATKAANTIGISDFGNSGINVLKNAKKGEKVYFYVTKEKIIGGGSENHK